MDKIVVLEDALRMPHVVWVDVRSPAEFAAGHIPGAFNISLFSDNERAVIGTIYKEIGQEDAKQEGLSIVAPKLPRMINEIRNIISSEDNVIIYCWRGGMRSRSVVRILEIMNMPAYQLQGGYKAHRRYVLETLRGLNRIPQVYVLCGSTGVGKTTMLTLLGEQGVPIIDLEKLANHRGSAFGQVGLGESATAQNFDAQLLLQLQQLQSEPYIVVECESKRIGNVYLPDILCRLMQEGKKILAEASVAMRVSRLIQEYVAVSEANHGAIINSIQSLTGRLGKKKVANLVAAFAAGHVEEVVTTLLLDYYDPLYGYDKTGEKKYDLVVNADDLAQTVSQIICYLR